MSNKSPSKLKPLPRPLFSCGIFRNCTQSVLSPSSPSQPPPPSSLPPPPSPPPPPPPPPTSDQRPPPSSSSSSSSSTSPSFTQWRFPLHHTHEANNNSSSSSNNDNQNATASVSANANGGGGDFYGAAREQFRSGATLAALRILEKSDPSGSGSRSICPVEVMAGVVAALKNPTSARPAAKVLLAMLLVEPNRRIAVEAGAVAAAVEAVVAAGGSTGASTAERALAALELMCTTDEGSSGVRRHALAAPAMGRAVESLQGRGRECAIGVLAAVYGGEHAKDAPEEVARAVMVAMQGDCTVRGKRKGGMLLRAMQECGRLDLDLNFD